MKTFKTLKMLGLAAGLIASLSLPAAAKVKVVGAYPYIAEIARQIGGNQVDASSLASGEWDPHFIVAKPSLLTRLNQAQLLVINGAQLEIGWLPPLLRQAGNARIQPGSTGFLELSNSVSLIQKPQQVTRAMGDVHPQGNPHFILNPDNVPKVANSMTNKLCQLDAANCKSFKANQSNFNQRWKQASASWAQRMAKLKGQRVLEYHRLHDYFFTRYGLSLTGTIEPLPGIPPSPQQLSDTVARAKSQKVQINVRGVYNPNDPSQFVSQRTGIKLVTLPHDIGAVPEAKDLFSLYDSILRRLGV